MQEYFTLAITPEYFTLAITPDNFTLANARIFYSGYTSWAQPSSCKELNDLVEIVQK